MRRIDCGVSGADATPVSLSWDDLSLSAPWPAVLSVLQPNSGPRPIQALALQDRRFFDYGRNLIVSAPTSGGKTLVGLLLLLDAIRRGRRAVLLEPLRAIAREKADDLQGVAPQLSDILGRRLSVRVTTGDYRLDDETFSAPPPESGELVVATPERLEAILRNPKHDDWLASIDTVCIDEAHLISSPHRGPTLEYLTTFLLSCAVPPRLALLSATLGNVDRLAAWLPNCAVVSVTERQPPLRKEILCLDAEDESGQAVIDFARDALNDPRAALLVFVYQTSSTQVVAKVLHDALGELTGAAGPLAYHAKMSLSQRETVRAAFRTGQCRCVITTTALGLGVNLPATHVLIRDAVFPGVGRLSTAELLQMMGRAGRGATPGHAAVLLRPNAAWAPDELSATLLSEELPDLTSHFERAAELASQRRQSSEPLVIAVATHVTSYLARRGEGGAKVEQLRRFFASSLGGAALTSHLDAALTWLIEPSHLLAYLDDYANYHLTRLGQRASAAVLPLPMVASLGQLFRDVISLDPSGALLRGWTPLDHLVVLHLLADRTPHLRPFSAQLATQVDAWMEDSRREHASLLYREWIGGQKGASRAGELLGSLGLHLTPDQRRAAANEDEWARQLAYRAIFGAIVIHERGQGKSIADLVRQWQAPTLEGVEERWRDDLLWLLSGLSKVLDLRCFYHHVRTEVGDDFARVKRFKAALRHMQLQTFDLGEHLKYCSPLGPLLRSIRRTRTALNSAATATVGIQSIRRLEDAGIHSVAALTSLGVPDLVKLGLRPDFAKQIHTYVRRRLQ